MFRRRVVLVFPRERDDFRYFAGGQDLRDAGVDELQAEAITRVFQQAATLPDVSDLATKTDLLVLRSDLKALKAELSGRLTALEGQLKTQAWVIGAFGTVLTVISTVSALAPALAKIIHG